MFSRSYGQLLAARSLIGLGEAGYGSVGAALIASIFPVRMRSVLMAAFAPPSGLGARRAAWRRDRGAVGMAGCLWSRGDPGLVLALLYLKVRDYRTVELTPQLDRATSSTGSAATFIVRARACTDDVVGLPGWCSTVDCRFCGVGLAEFSQPLSWPRTDQAAIKAALVVLCGAAGSVIWGWVVGRAGAKRPRYKLHAMTALCIVAMLVLMWAFGHMAPAPSQFWLIALGGFVMTCTVGPVVAVVIDVVHPVAARPELRSWRCSRTYSVLPPDRLSEACYRMPSARDGTHCDPGVRPAGRILFHTRCAYLQSRHSSVEDVHVEVDRSGSVAQPA